MNLDTLLRGSVEEASVEDTARYDRFMTRFARRMALAIGGIIAGAGLCGLLEAWRVSEMLTGAALLLVVTVCVVVLVATGIQYENFRKRSQREKEAVYPDAVAATVEKFLQVVDNFERAMACETQDKEYKKGVDLIYSSLLDTLQKLQVEAYAQVGDSFEPELHNAVMHVEDENFGENVISAVFQKGYKIGERVIRHAMVQVAN